MTTKNIFLKSITYSIPLGIIGLYAGIVNMYFWLLLMIIFLLVFCNRIETGMFLTFIGTSLFGRIFGTEIMVLLSTILFSVIGIILLRKEIAKAIVWNQMVFMWYMVFIAYFVVMYLLGYQNTYTQSKILKLAIRGTIWYIMFLVFVQSSTISYTKFSFLFLLTALFFLSQSYQLYAIKPSHFFDLDFFRRIGNSLRTEWGASTANPHTLGYLAVASLTFHLMNKDFFHKKIIPYTILICLCSFIIVLISGARQTLICYVIVFAIGIVRKMDLSFMGKLSILLSIVFIILIIVSRMGSENMNRFLLSEGEDAGYRLHRDIDTPLKMMTNLSAFGLGFGGYWELAGRYPHNLFVEMLLEYGIIGTLFIIIMSILIIKTNGYSILTYKTIQGAPLVLLFVVFFLESMISGDMSGNVCVFALLFCCVKLRPPNKNRIIISQEIKNRPIQEKEI